MLSPLHSRTMVRMRIAQAAELLGVSDDSVRRWVDAGRLPASRTGGVLTIESADLAAYSAEHAQAPDSGASGRYSARNQFKGIVTAIKSDSVMSQVDIQAGPFRVVSLLSTEAVREMGLDVGSIVVASTKATNVTVEHVDLDRR